jgi:hypothetical protein
MNSIIKSILPVLLLIAFASNNSVAKRMQFLKRYCFSYTKGDKTSIIKIDYVSQTKFVGEISTASEGNEDATIVGISGTDKGGVLTKSFNDTPPEFIKGQKYSRQAWKIVKGKNGKETLQVKYYILGKKTKYVTYNYTACAVGTN